MDSSDITIRPDLGFAQGPATVATSSEIAKEGPDYDGYTNPNLHRRIDPKDPSSIPGREQETQPRDIELGVYGLHSYKTTALYTHDEESDEEIP